MRDEMDYKIAFCSDVGLVKQTNQDSLCIHTAKTENGNIVFAVMCDGMGGLEKGEVASATLIRAFSNWFRSDLPQLICSDDPLNAVRYSWDRLIKIQNKNISEYGRSLGIQLGSTITLFLCLSDGKCIIGHVGDSRAYRITDSEIFLLTEDQTVVANEIRCGRLTPEQAKTDPRRNVLLQCIGASKIVEPAFYIGQVMPDECYMLCSDGFRHVITEEEIHTRFRPNACSDEAGMRRSIEELIDLNKFRHENDNISALLIKTQ